MDQFCAQPTRSGQIPKISLAGDRCFPVRTHPETGEKILFVNAYTTHMWDNRSTQHYAVMDYPPCHRKMERAGIVGEATY